MLTYTMLDFGKFLNGYGLHTYHLAPEGWDLTEILVSNLATVTIDCISDKTHIWTDRTVPVQFQACSNIHQRRTASLLSGLAPD